MALMQPCLSFERIDRSDTSPLSGERRDQATKEG